ncbi:MAG TPA: lysophospholipid acyltransferase family protein [Candidatus Binataceae bacterium]|nr:lysophospholipid acyltransferase family protein [Candidatus Binataceae bacterium]
MARQTSGVAARAEFILFSAARATLQRLPLARAVWLGTKIGTLAAAADRFNRPIAMRNLAIAFPDYDRARHREILAAMYRNWGRMAAEWCHLPKLGPDQLKYLVSYDGVENWRAGEALSAGRGGLLVTAHFGNWELMAHAHALNGHPIAIVYRPLRNRLIDRLVSEQRARVGNQIIARKGAGRDVVLRLQRNQHVVIPIDLDVRRGVFVNFFGCLASTTDAPARLALVSGAPVAPVFIVREDQSLRHRIVIRPVIEVLPGPDRLQTIRDYTQRFSAEVEAMIRRYPDHWNWIHRRWKTRPAGEKRFY